MEVVGELDGDRIRGLLDGGTFFWLDLLNPGEQDLETLSELLGLHPAATEDTREWDQPPRLDDYGDHVLLVFFSAREHGGQVEPVEVHVYVSGGWIFTARNCETPLEGLKDWLAATDDADDDRVLYLILDRLADGWDPVIEAVDRRVDEVEGAVLERPQQGQLTTIYRLKQEVVELLRRANPQRASFDQSVQVIHELPGFERGQREWLRDVEAHLDAVHSDLQRLSSDLNALTDTFFNANANRLNRLVTLVTIGSVFFLMWTLITGFFGQNFGWLEQQIETKEAFLAYGLGGLLVPTLLLAAVLWWRRRDWW